MSLAAQTANTASNMNRSLTLAVVIDALEKAQGRYVESTALLELINDDLSTREVKRIELVNEPRVKAELADNPQLREVLG